MVAVLDTIHGAGLIADRLTKLGYEAHALEVYHHSQSLDGYDLVVAPVHLAPNVPTMLDAKKRCIEVITHHRAVGEIVNGYEEKEYRSFEITGTRGKTTTALLTSIILSYMGKTITHTTRGIELWQNGKSQTIRSGLSITPANVILANEAAKDNQADYLISEVSLGGTGAFDYGVLTTFTKDYRIAMDSMWASTAKLQMITLANEGSCLVANTDTRITSDVSFGEKGQINVVGSDLQVGDKKIPLRLGEGLHIDSYRYAISAAMASVYAAGIAIEEAIEALNGFEGFEGRMKRYLDDGFVIYDNANSGLSAPGVLNLLDYSKGKGRLCLITGEDAKTVCEGMDIQALAKILEDRSNEIDLLILVGERMEPYALKFGALTAKSLNEGFKIAISRLSKGDRILLGVKCFR